tara:strand:- start:204 stop:842 length:639 start_codon:yes stop_codon:yes gene_type:complete
MHNLQLEVQEPYFSQLLNGKKTVEGRLRSAKNKLLNSGDIILFTNRHSGTDFSMIVTKCETYPTFFDMLNNVGFKKCIPDAKNIQAAVAVYHSFPGYQQKEVEKGVVCYHVVPEKDFFLQSLQNTKKNKSKDEKKTTKKKTTTAKKKNEKSVTKKKKKHAQKKKTKVNQSDKNMKTTKKTTIAKKKNEKSVTKKNSKHAPMKKTKGKASGKA